MKEKEEHGRARPGWSLEASRRSKFKVTRKMEQFNNSCGSIGGERWRRGRRRGSGTDGRGKVGIASVQVKPGGR